MRAAERSTDALRAAILGGGLATDGRLPPERSLAEQLGVSRSRLRRILDDLAGEGLVFRRHGQGTFLLPPPAQAPARLGTLARRVSPRDLMEVRLDLEPGAAARAAERGDPTEKARLLRLMEDTLSARTLAEYERADDLFHHKIVEMTGNPLLLTLFEEVRSLRRATAWTRARQSSLGPEDMAEGAVQHSAIANAICAGATEAARKAMRDHLEQVAANLMRPRS